jgi:hypothetical protein
MDRRPDTASVVAGVLVTLLGVLVLLDSSGTVDLDFAYALPAAFASAGVVLLLVGLGRGR